MKDDPEVSVEINAEDRATPALEEAARKAAVVGLEAVVADMTQLRAGLLRTMPGEMDNLTDRIDTWCRGIMPAIRALRRVDSDS